MASVANFSIWHEECRKKLRILLTNQSLNLKRDDWSLNPAYSFIAAVQDCHFAEHSEKNPPYLALGNSTQAANLSVHHPLFLKKTPVIGLSQNKIVVLNFSPEKIGCEIVQKC